MKADRIFGLSVILIAAFYLFHASLIPMGFLSDPVGSRTFPYIIGGVSLLCGILIMIFPDTITDWPELKVYGKLAVAVLAMYLFAITLRPYGFIIPSAIVAIILSYLISPNIKHAIITGVGLSIGLFLVLNFGLGLGLYAFG